MVNCMSSLRLTPKANHRVKCSHARKSQMRRMLGILDLRLNNPTDKCIKAKTIRSSTLEFFKGNGACWATAITNFAKNNLQKVSEKETQENPKNPESVSTNGCKNSIELSPYTDAVVTRDRISLSFRINIPWSARFT